MEKQYTFTDDRISGKTFTLNMGSTFTDPSLNLDDEFLKVSAGNCYVKADNGEKLKIKLNKGFLDRFPSVLVGEKEYVFVKPLTLVKKIALFLPFFFIITNGFLGLIAALFLWIVLGKMFRSDSSPLIHAVKYLSAVIITLILLILTSGLIQVAMENL